MKLYKDTTGNIFAYELDGSQDHLISPDLVALTQDEIIAREEMLANKKLQGESLAKAFIDAQQSALNKLMALGLTREEAFALGIKSNGGEQ